jgi:hypothetical protein
MQWNALHLLRWLACRREPDTCYQIAIVLADATCYLPLEINRRSVRLTMSGSSKTVSVNVNDLAKFLILHGKWSKARIERYSQYHRDQFELLPLEGLELRNMSPLFHALRECLPSLGVEGDGEHSHSVGKYHVILADTSELDKARARFTVNTRSRW